MLLLVDAHGYEVGIVDEDVSRHEHRIGKQARVDILRMPGTLFLKLVHTRQLAEGRAAGEHPRQLRMSGHMALYEQHAPVRVDAASQQQRRSLPRLAAQVRRRLAHGDGVHVGDHINTVIIALQRVPVAHRAHIIAQRKSAGGLDAAQDAFFLFFHFGFPLLFYNI